MPESCGHRTCGYSFFLIIVGKKKKDNKKKQKLCIYCSGVYKLAPIAGERIGAGTPPPNSDD